MTALLQLRDVRVTGASDIVHGVSFEIAAGARFGIIGESGSGKSLTTLAALGLLPDGLTASGSVTFRGTELLGASAQTLTGVRGRGMTAVFQDALTALDPLMRIGDQLAWPLRHHGGLRGDALADGVLDAFREVALPDPQRIAHSYVHEISGGQRQRVAIALALACSPALLIADEPTTALDLSVQAEILDLLDAVVRDRSTALLLISHDLAVVARMTDEILVLRDGVAVEHGPTHTLLTAPEHAYTRLLVDTARTLEGFLPGERR